MGGSGLLGCLSMSLFSFCLNSCLSIRTFWRPLEALGGWLCFVCMGRFVAASDPRPDGPFVLPHFHPLRRPLLRRRRRCDLPPPCGLFSSLLLTPSVVHHSLPADVHLCLRWCFSRNPLLGAPVFFFPLSGRLPFSSVGVDANPQFAFWAGPWACGLFFPLRCRSSAHRASRPSEGLPLAGPVGAVPPLQTPVFTYRARHALFPIGRAQGSFLGPPPRRAVFLDDQLLLWLIPLRPCAGLLFFCFLGPALLLVLKIPFRWQAAGFKHSLFCFVGLPHMTSSHLPLLFFRFTPIGPSALHTRPEPAFGVSVLVFGVFLSSHFPLLLVPAYAGKPAGVRKGRDFP